MDRLLVATLVLAFAAFVTAHVALAAGVLARGPWWRGIVALLVPPAAPWLGHAAGLRGRTFAWWGALALYAGALASAYVAR